MRRDGKRASSGVQRRSCLCCHHIHAAHAITLSTSRPPPNRVRRSTPPPFPPSLCCIIKVGRQKQTRVPKIILQGLQGQAIVWIYNWLIMHIDRRQHCSDRLPGCRRGCIMQRYICEKQALSSFFKNWTQPVYHTLHTLHHLSRPGPSHCNTSEALTHFCPYRVLLETKSWQWTPAIQPLSHPLIKVLQRSPL